MKVRPATAADLDALVALNAHVQDLHVAHMPERYRPTDPAEVRAFFSAQLAQPGTEIALAVAGHEAWGYVVIVCMDRPGSPFGLPDRVLMVDQIAVDRAAQGRGAGRALMAWAEVRAAALDCQGIVLDVLAFNTEAIGFYEHLGYAPQRLRLHRPVSAS